MRVSYASLAIAEYFTLCRLRELQLGMRALFLILDCLGTIMLLAAALKPRPALASFLREVCRVWNPHEVAPRA